MLKVVSFILLISVFFSGNSQDKQMSISDLTNIEKTIFMYNPIQKENVSDSEFSKGVSILKNSLLDFKESKEKTFCYVDYWNITVSFLYFDESSEKIEYLFKKAIELNSENVYIYMSKIKNQKDNPIYEKFLNKIPETVHSFMDKTNEIADNRSVDVSKTSESIDNNLTILIKKVLLNDQKYRSNINLYKKKLALQTSIDKKNQVIIDSLYSHYNSYIGKSLVGDEYKATMWAVIQHSDIDTMNKYLPVIHQAVIDKELPKGPLKMLIDRIHHIEHGTQIFGSQAGVEMADEKTIQQVINQYDMDNL